MYKFKAFFLRNDIDFHKLNTFLDNDEIFVAQISNHYHGHTSPHCSAVVKYKKNEKISTQSKVVPMKWENPSPFAYMDADTLFEIADSIIATAKTMSQFVSAETWVKGILEERANRMLYRNEILVGQKNTTTEMELRACLMDALELRKLHFKRSRHNHVRN